MFTSKFSKPGLSRLGLSLLLVLLLAACSSVPEPAPAPAPVPVPEPAAAAEETLPEPEAVDFNQQFYEDAIAALKAGETEDAIDLLVQVSHDAPEKPFVFTNLGLAYFKLERFDLARQAFEQAVQRNDRDAVAYNHLGVLQRQQGNFEQALQNYQRAIDIDADYAGAHLNLGILFDIYLQDLAKALRQYQTYQSLIGEEDSRVAGWIVDIERRLKSPPAKSQG